MQGKAGLRLLNTLKQKQPQGFYPRRLCQYTNLFLTPFTNGLRRHAPDTVWLLEEPPESAKANSQESSTLLFYHATESRGDNAKICSNSPLSLCRKQHPQQISLTEQHIIKETCGKKEYEYWPLSNIYAQMMRDNKLHCSISTFYKYCRLLNITHKPLRKNAKYTPLLAVKPLQVLHLDTTIYKTVNNVKHYLYVVRDNFSRAILGCRACLQYSSEQARNTLEEVLTKYNLLDKEGTLITDNGPENKGRLTDLLAKPDMLWKRLVAQVDIIQSNSMVEAANKILKCQYLFTQNIADTQALENILPAALNDYNNRPQYLLTCHTPSEVLAGAIPDKQRFKQAIEEAKKQRTEANRKGACNNTC